MRERGGGEGGPAPVAPDRVRLDKWLWAARFFKTRPLAAAAIERGQVRVAGERVKPAREARIGERIEIMGGDERTDVTVVALSDVRGPAPVARTLYAELPDSVARRERRREQRRFGTEPAAALKGRPTKREGRLLRRAGGGAASD